MDIIAAINRATGCQHCGGPLGDSPSTDFCGEHCQSVWASALVEPIKPLPIGGVTHVGEVPARLDAEDLRFLLNNQEHLFRAVAETMGALTVALSSAFEKIGQYLIDCGFTDSEPATLPERALYLRKNRNTGPTARVRAPRTINPTRTLG